MDGVGGISQDPIKPGKSCTYEFHLSKPGTFMFHSHVNLYNQVNSELLFGTLIVEDKNQQSYKNKESLIFNYEPTNDLNTVNGLNMKNITFNSNENIKLNIVNIASTPISLYFGDNVSYKINSVDAHNVTSSYYTNQSLYIPTANRVDLTIKNTNKNFIIYIKDYTNNFNEIVHVNLSKNNISQISKNKLYKSDNYLYNIINTNENLDVKDKIPDKTFDMTLDMQHMNWVINNKAYPKTSPLKVDEGDLVQINLTSTGHMNSVHPFHLHGHEFELISLDGKQFNNNLVLDTIEIKPNHTYSIRFYANNPGIWAFHCHDLNHSSKGMATTLNYNGYETNAKGSME